MASPDPDCLSFALNKDDFLAWVASAYPEHLRSTDGTPDMQTALATISHTLRLLAYQGQPKHQYQGGGVALERSLAN